MFADPQSVTVNAVAQSMPCVSRERTQSIYQKADGSYTLTLTHQVSKAKERHIAKLDHRKLTTDPYTPANNVDVASKSYMVFDAPVTGFSDTELRNDALGLIGWLSSGNIDKLLGLET